MFDRLARVAFATLRAPMALVMVFDAGSARVVGEAGCPGARGLEVPAASVGRRVAQREQSVEPSVLRGTWEAGKYRARSAYAVPLRAPDGSTIGVFLFMDTRRRTWTAVQMDAARTLAASAECELERQDAQLRLAQAESYQEVLERSPEGVLVHANGRIVLANPAAVALLGARDASDLVGRSIDTFLTPPFLGGVKAQLVSAGGPFGPPTFSEERLARADGTVRYVEVASLAYLHDDVPTVQLFMRDVTERRAAQEVLRARGAHLRLLLERIPALIWTTDTDLNMEVYGRGRAVPGTTVRAFFGGGAESVPVMTHRQALAGESVSNIVEWGGSLYEMRVEPLRGEHGSVVGTVGVAMDTTLRRRAEEQERAEREMDMLIRVAGGVAHGFNNALATIVGLASVMLEHPPSEREVKQNLRKILDASERARVLTSNLLGFARQGRYRTVRIDLNAVASEAAQCVRSRQRSVKLSLEPDLPVVIGDSQQVIQAIANVCQNAVEATYPGGTIQISTRLVRVDEGGSDTLHLQPGSYVCVEVGDSGKGMSPEVRARAAEPFFTTKEVGKGVGLGLSMAFGVVRHHAGDLHIDSTPGGGTTVQLYFPVAAETTFLSAPPLRPSAAPPTAPGKGLVLVVDDDEWVRFSSRRILESLGYEVAEAADGATAIDLYREAERPFAFVLLDLRMPGMDGEQVLRHLLEIDPNVRVIICTGYERDQVSQRIFTLGHVGFLGKPFEVRALQEQLAQVGAEPELV